MRRNTEIAQITINVDPRIEDGNIDQVQVTIQYKVKKESHETQIIDLYCRSEHEYSITGMLRKAELVKASQGTLVLKHKVTSITIKQIRTIGTTIAKDYERQKN